MKREAGIPYVRHSFSPGESAVGRLRCAQHEESQSSPPDIHRSAVICVSCISIDVAGIDPRHNVTFTVIGARLVGVSILPLILVSSTCGPAIGVAVSRLSAAPTCCGDASLAASTWWPTSLTPPPVRGG